MEDELKEMLGDQYHEGMTAAEVQEYFKKSFLESGDYVNKDKSKAEIAKLQKDLADKNKLLQDKMSEKEKEEADRKAQSEELENLKELLRQAQIDNNKSKSLAIIASAIEKADIKADDKDFNEFISNISSDNLEKTTKISNYLSKIINSAYEKGKSDSTKTQMANMGKFGAKGSETDSSDNDESVKFAQDLAKSNTKKVSNNPYFKI